MHKMLGKLVNNQPKYTMYTRKRHLQTPIPQVQLSVIIMVVLIWQQRADSETSSAISAQASSQWKFAEWRVTQ